MRKVCLIACVSLLMSTGPTLAAECTKGMLWPYVRAAGDCLTDAEIAAGQKGTYNGPMNTNVDVSAIKPAEIPAQAGSVGGTGRSDGALIEKSVFGAEPPSRSVAQCNKGILWPFKREPGDCLTEGEKRAGQTGVYGGAAASPEAAAAPATAPAAGAQPTPPTNAVAQCNKGLLWPFSREPGDCLTEAEKRSGQTGVYGAAAAVAQTSATAAATTTAAPAQATGAPASASPAAGSAQPAPQAVSCSKGWFWPFVKESSDCPSDADKRNSGQK